MSIETLPIPHVRFFKEEDLFTVNLSRCLRETSPEPLDRFTRKVYYAYAALRKDAEIGMHWMLFGSSDAPLSLFTDTYTPSSLKKTRDEVYRPFFMGKDPVQVYVTDDEAYEKLKAAKLQFTYVSRKNNEYLLQEAYHSIPFLPPYMTEQNSDMEMVQQSLEKTVQIMRTSGVIAPTVLDTRATFLRSILREMSVSEQVLEGVDNTIQKTLGFPTFT